VEGAVEACVGEGVMVWLRNAWGKLYWWIQDVMSPIDRRLGWGLSFSGFECSLRDESVYTRLRWRGRWTPLVKVERHIDWAGMDVPRPATISFHVWGRE